MKSCFSTRGGRYATIIGHDLEGLSCFLAVCVLFLLHCEHLSFPNSRLAMITSVLTRFCQILSLYKLASFLSIAYSTFIFSLKTCFEEEFAIFWKVIFYFLFFCFLLGLCVSPFFFSLHF